jgi:hypothetical protein
LQKCRERLRTKDPNLSDPSPDPAQAGSYMHRAALNQAENDMVYQESCLNSMHLFCKKYARFTKELTLTGRLHDILLLLNHLGPKMEIKDRSMLKCITCCRNG